MECGKNYRKETYLYEIEGKKLLVRVFHCCGVRKYIYGETVDLERTDPVWDKKRNSSNHWQEWHAYGIHPTYVKIHQQLRVSIIELEWWAEILFVEILLCIPTCTAIQSNIDEIWTMTGSWPGVNTYEGLSTTQAHSPNIVFVVCFHIFRQVALQLSNSRFVFIECDQRTNVRLWEWKMVSMNTSRCWVILSRYYHGHTNHLP